MSYIAKTISEVVTEYLNRRTFLPTIQREYVWGTYGIEKLFDSIMNDYPISKNSFTKSHRFRTQKRCENFGKYKITALRKKIKIIFRKNCIFAN